MLQLFIFHPVWDYPVEQLEVKECDKALQRTDSTSVEISAVYIPHLFPVLLVQGDDLEGQHFLSVELYQLSQGRSVPS